MPPPCSSSYQAEDILVALSNGLHASALRLATESPPAGNEAPSRVAPVGLAFRHVLGRRAKLCTGLCLLASRGGADNGQQLSHVLSFSTRLPLPRR